MFGVHAEGSGASTSQSNHVSARAFNSAGSSFVGFTSEAAIIDINNEKLKLLTQFLQLDDWYVRNQPPGYFWSAKGLNARFYVDQLVCSQKMAICCEHKHVA